MVKQRREGSNETSTKKMCSFKKSRRIVCIYRCFIRKGVVLSMWRVKLNTCLDYSAILSWCSSKWWHFSGVGLQDTENIPNIACKKKVHLNLKYWVIDSRNQGTMLRLKNPLKKPPAMPNESKFQLSDCMEPDLNLGKTKITLDLLIVRAHSNRNFLLFQVMWGGKYLDILHNL